MSKGPRVLFFINGPVPTDEDRLNANATGNNVVFRNAALVDVDGCLEDCAGVAGAVPTLYKNKYPSYDNPSELVGAPVGTPVQTLNKAEQNIVINTVPVETQPLTGGWGLPILPKSE